MALFAKGNFPRFKKLVTRDPEWFKKGSYAEGGNTLHRAVYHRAIKEVKFLVIKKHWDINVRDKCDRSPFMYGVFDWFCVDMADQNKEIFPVLSLLLSVGHQLTKDEIKASRVKNIFFDNYFKKKKIKVSLPPLILIDFFVY